jgi:hypothetical protein
VSLFRRRPKPSSQDLEVILSELNAADLGSPRMFASGAHLLFQARQIARGLGGDVVLDLPSDAFVYQPQGPATAWASRQRDY